MSNTGINNYYDKPLEAVGSNVILRKEEVYHERFVGNLIITDDADINCRTNKAVVESVGENVDKTIKVGDTVIYDYFGAYADTHPIVALDERNVIGVFSNTEPDRNVIIPVGERLLLKSVLDRGRTEGGIFIPDDALDESSKTTEEAVVVGYGGGCEMKYKIGDVLLVSQNDIMRLTLGGEKFVVVKESKVIAVVSRKLED